MPDHRYKAGDDRTGSIAAIPAPLEDGVKKKTRPSVTRRVVPTTRRQRFGAVQETTKQADEIPPNPTRRADRSWAPTPRSAQTSNIGWQMGESGRECITNEWSSLKLEEHQAHGE